MPKMSPSMKTVLFWGMIASFCGIVTIPIGLICLAAFAIFPASED
jgi:hypothetical protein